MYIIGERINGMFRDVAEAIRNRDKRVIQDLAMRQLSCGADALDVCCGPNVENPIDAMRWLVETIREVSDATLSIDTTKKDVMQAGLELAGKGKCIINSISAEEKKLNEILPLAKEFNAKVIALTLTEKGIPKDASSRVEIAAELIDVCQQYISIDDLFIDAVILPVNVAQEHCPEVLETIRQVKMLSSPPPKTVLGLSNVSQKCLNRSLVNRTYLALAISAGLDAAILDCTDSSLMDTLITAELLMNKFLYCDDYLAAYRKRKLG